MKSERVRRVWCCRRPDPTTWGSQRSRIRPLERTRRTRYEIDTAGCRSFLSPPATSAAYVPDANTMLSRAPHVRAHCRQIGSCAACADEMVRPLDVTETVVSGRRLGVYRCDVSSVLQL